MTKKDAKMKKPYCPPEIEIYTTALADMLGNSAIPVGEDPDNGFGEIRFF